jgi:hypothetical protein
MDCPSIDGLNLSAESREGIKKSRIFLNWQTNLPVQRQEARLSAFLPAQLPL